MSDYAAYDAARQRFGEQFVAYHAERLERGHAILQIEADGSQRRTELEHLERRAREAADRAGRRGGGRVPATLVAAEVGDAIAKVSAMSNNSGSVWESRRRKAAGREAGAYLTAAERLFAPEMERLKAQQRANVEAEREAQARADAEIKRAAEELQALARTAVASAGTAAQPLTDPSWGDPGWEAGDGVIRLADAHRWIDGERYECPYLAQVPGENIYISHLYFPDKSRSFINNTLLRAIRSRRPGRVRLLLIDPTSLGDVFSPLLSLGEHSEAIITSKVWTTEADIRTRLEEASDRVGLILQKYLTDEYETLEEYNRAAGEVSEENVVIAINDFPLGLDQRSIEIVKSLAEVGPRCGVSLLIRRAAKLSNERAEVCREISRTGHRLGSWAVADDFRNWDRYDGRWVHYRPRRFDEQVRETMGAFLDLLEVEAGGLAWREESYSWVSGSGQGWHSSTPEDWRPELAEPVLDFAARRFAAGARVEVRMDKVWQLFADSRGSGTRPALDDPETLWRERSAEELAVPVGRHGSRGVSTFRFDSQLHSSALLVGRPGSGKSNLLHVIICTLAAMYPPEELELYLLDFKEAVEFAAYASNALPHARAIALESDREFGLAVLRHLSAEIERRGRQFREAGEQSNLVAYRSATGRTLPRILLLIDEFHRLFDREDALATEAAKYLDDVVRLGRGFGIHCLLASQTLLGMTALGRHTLNQIAIRAALQCSDEDSRLVFNDDNPAAALLTRPGEAVMNSSGGRLAGNEPFQVPLLTDQDRGAVLRSVDARARRSPRPWATRVYRRDVQAPWDLPEPAPEGAVVRARFGDAVAIDPYFAYDLTREGGKNVLVVGRNEMLAGDMLAAALADLALRHSGSVELTVVDLMAIDGAVSRIAESVGATVVRRRGLEDTLLELARRVEAEEPARQRDGATRVLVINGLGKARDLDPDDYSEEGQQLVGALRTILRDGPDVGVHTVVWADSLATAERRLARLEREFGARVLFRMGVEDSLRLADSQVANELREREAVLVDMDRGTMVKFQPFESPDVEDLVAAREVGDLV